LSNHKVGETLVSPIALFAYNRPEKVRFAIESLAKNDLAEFSDLYVFVDGPKSLKDIALIQEVEEIIHTAGGFKSVNLKKSKVNLGLSMSIRKGIDFVLDLAPAVIVIEDDLVLAKSFLNYINEGLNRFVDDSRVASIQGYQYPCNPPLQKSVALRGADCWGWATWKDRWQSSIFDANLLYEQIRSQNLQNEFDLYGAMPYMNMLKNQINGEIDSWAICWHASMFLKGLVSLYPAESLVVNNGNDGKGTHGTKSKMFDTKLGTWTNQKLWPDPVEDIDYKLQLIKYFKFHFQSANQNSFTKAKNIVLSVKKCFSYK
jgi:glycosyltransferase involved in cell wall biosynthesis